MEMSFSRMRTLSRDSRCFCNWEYLLFCAPKSFVTMKTYFRASKPFGQLIIPRAVDVYKPCCGSLGSFLGAVSAGLLWTGNLGPHFQSHKTLGSPYASLAPGNSAASCNPQLLLSCQTHLRNSGQHRPALNGSGSASVKSPNDNRKITWEV